MNAYQWVVWFIDPFTCTSADVITPKKNWSFQNEKLILLVIMQFLERGFYIFKDCGHMRPWLQLRELFEAEKGIR